MLGYVLENESLGKVKLPITESLGKTKRPMTYQFPECNPLSKDACRISDTLYICTSVPHILVQNPEQQAPNELCLGGRSSWGVCSNGEWLCKCSHEGKIELWQNKCSKAPPRNKIPDLEDFVGSNYRLGNLIDMWYRYRVSAYEQDEKKVEDIMFDLVFKSPENSFARFLYEHRRDPGRSNFTWLRNTAFEIACHTFWLYEYSAVAVVQTNYKHMIDEIVEKYLHENNVSLPQFTNSTCVVHYRLGDMLSLGVLDPVWMAEAVYNWSISQDLKITNFYILGAGINYTKNEGEIIAGRRLLHKFISQLKIHFSQSNISIDIEGTPDEDWFKMYSAPLLFTAHGSYAISAAAASSGIRATPAMDNTNFPDCDTGYQTLLSRGWNLYKCKDIESEKIFVPPSTGVVVNSCLVGSTNYSCIAIKDFKVVSKRSASPHARCLSGLHAWGICQDGQWLCNNNDSKATDANQPSPVRDVCNILGEYFVCIRSFSAASEDKNKCLDLDASSGICSDGALLCKSQ